MQESGDRKVVVSRSFVYFSLAIFGLVQFVLIAGVYSATYFYLIVPRITDVSQAITDVSQTSAQAKTWMEDRVAGKFGMRLKYTFIVPELHNLL